MTHLNPARTGFTLGTFFAGVHLLWALIVLAGWGQTFLNFIFTLHMIVPVYTVASFNLLRAVELVVLSAIVGYIVGFVFARIWNKQAKRAQHHAS